MQRSVLENEIARALNDLNNTRWTLAIIDSRLEFAQQDVQIVTDAVKSTETLTPTSNTATIALSTSLLDVLAVTLTDSSGNVTPLHGFTKEELFVRRPLWPNETPGQPDSYYVDFTTNTLYLVPAPSAQWAIANAIIVTEVQIPAAMTGDTSVPFGANSLMIPYHKALKYWVVAECLLDNNDQESLQKAQFYRSGNLDRPGEYEKVIKEILSRFDKPTDARPRILWRPQGGRLGGWPVSKSSPLG